MYQCVCFNFKVLHEHLDDQFRYTGKNIDEIRCKSGSRSGVCPDCKKNIWDTLTDRVSTKSFNPNDILKTIFNRHDTHADLCKNLPKYADNESVPNMVEHNKVVLKGLNQLLYQNYILTMMEERKRVTDLLVKFKKDLQNDLENLNSIQNRMDSKFAQLSTSFEFKP